MRAAKTPTLTTPDLVLLSLLAERPLHGYQANLELERREVRDWAGISRPQVYYSLEKLARAKLIRTAGRAKALAGPEHQAYTTTAKGLAALADALERDDWTTLRDRPPFLTWMALSWQARPGVFRRQLERRRKFLERELARELATLRSIHVEVGHRFHEAVWMVSLMIRQFRTELRWLRRLVREIPRRAPARYPDYAAADCKRPASSAGSAGVSPAFDHARGLRAGGPRSQEVHWSRSAIDGPAFEQAGLAPTRPR